MVTATPRFINRLAALWGVAPRRWRPAVLAFLGLLAGAVLWGSGLDERLQEWLWVTYDQNVNTVMRVLGELGKGTAQAGLLMAVAGTWSLVAWVRHRWLPDRLKLLWGAVPVFALAGVANWVLKVMVGRPRPKEILMNGGDPWTPHPFTMDATFWSFPSGHACSTWAIAVWLACVFPRWRLPLFLVAIVLSASRFLAVTPHYLGDVLAGSALGAAIALAAYQAVEARRHA